jgi:hypothetical protein
MSDLMRWIREALTIDDNLGRHFDWLSFLVLVSYSACVDAVARMIGRPNQPQGP